MRSDTSTPNRLINEKSPYLLQHAYNPVDWHPWSNETFRKAMDLDKPIFLSVGYSTCYWCHVMEREVFENIETAEKMNRYFVNVKVDREERPDVDRVYMNILQAITGSGGWPMSIFLTPDLKPFYAATYIPPKSKYGRAGFEDVIEEIQKLWNEKKEEVIRSSENIVNALDERLRYNTDSSGSGISMSIFNNGLSQFERAYDSEFGGFGTGNKFPRPVGLDYLLNLYKANKEFPALDMVLFTLKKMHEGGMYDHLGGGFHRYAVDKYWRVPHFEKMLYDQAQLVRTYVNAYLVTRNEYFLSVAEHTASYMLKNLYSPEGGFYSAEDAESIVNSEGNAHKEEGAFYLWQKSEIDKVLGVEVSRIFCYHFGIELHGNTIHDPHEVFGSKNVLYIAHDLFDTAKKFGMPVEELTDLIRISVDKLLDIRKERPAPSLDDKLLTNWNALAISAFCTLYNCTGKKEYIETAISTARFIIDNLTIGDSKSKLLHRYKDGDARFDGTLEDYAFFTASLLDLYESTFIPEFLEYARSICETAIELFWDEENGGFFDASPDAGDIILKTKETYDGAEPSGNSVQIMNLLRLAAMTDEQRFNGLAEKSLLLYANDLSQMPFSSPSMLCALRFFLSGPAEVVISGDPSDKTANGLAMVARGIYLPEKILVNATPESVRLFPYLSKIVSAADSAAAYVCRNRACSLPTNDKTKLSELLNFE